MPFRRLPPPPSDAARSFGSGAPDRFISGTELVIDGGMTARCD